MRVLQHEELMMVQGGLDWELFVAFVFMSGVTVMVAAGLFTNAPLTIQMGIMMGLGMMGFIVMGATLP